ncbi:MAG: cupredoxin domain-containing protein [Anaerolineales bacterium]|jgi:plastocyanin
MRGFSRVSMYSLIMLLAIMSLTACRKGTQVPPEGASAPGISVTITGSTCPSVIVTVGDQVTWTNQDNQDHLIRIESSEGEVVAAFGELKPGDTASFTFPQAGNYSYSCSANQDSTGIITVQP